LTGPIGCGKSTVARWLGERQGVIAVDADRIAQEVLGPGTAEVEAVYRRFGPALRRADGTLDRAELGRLVFADPVALRELEAIVHPAVRPRILAAIAEADRAGARAVVVEAIKLVEGGLAESCDEVWLVTCDEEVQLERLIGRGMEPTDAAARLAAQRGLATRLRPRATRVIDTSGSAEATSQIVERLLTEALAR
jgi:dephospho-CoA kinase